MDPQTVLAQIIRARFDQCPGYWPTQKSIAEAIVAQLPLFGFDLREIQEDAA